MDGSIAPKESQRKEWLNLCREHHDPHVRPRAT